MKNLFINLGIFITALFAWKIFIFTHPYPNSILRSIFWFLFLITFLAYIFSIRLGRILLVFLAISSTRLASMAFHTDLELITNAPVFIGGISGLIFRSFYFQKRKHLSSPNREPIFFILIFFLWTLLLDRFLVYYNFPFIKQTGLQELEYTPKLTSKMAFAFSVEIFAGIFFPALYFLLEEREKIPKLSRDLISGVVLTLVINAIVIAIQTYINLDFFSFQTNLAPTYGRATGLFRDAGSASFIFPAMLLFLFNYFLHWKFSKKNYFLIFFIVLTVLLGKSLGRAFWILGILTIPYIVLYKAKALKNSGFYFLSFFVIFVILAYKAFLNRNPELVLRLLNGEISSLDPQRFILNKIAWFSFTQSLFFGNGLGSFPTLIDNPTHPLYNPSQVIDSPMFIFGLLSDLGILGNIFLLLYLVFISFHYKNSLGIWILGSSFIIGYHVNHPDSAFWILLMLTYLNKTKTRFSLGLVKILLVLLGLNIVIYLPFILQKLSYAEKVPLVRYEVINKYQLQAYSLNNKAILDNREIKYHTFLGSVIWKVQPNSHLFKVHFFLSDHTKINSLNLKLSFLDKTHTLIANQAFYISKWQKEKIIFTVPENTEFIQVDELSENGKVIKLGKHIYSVNILNFNGKNELVSYENDSE